MKNYISQVPVRNDLFTEETCADYLDILKKTKSGRVLFTIQHLCQPEQLNEELIRKRDYLEKNGIETGIWFGETFGHGCPISGLNPGEVTSFQQIVGINGSKSLLACCPLDNDFKRYFADNLKKLASYGFRLFLLDDDFRLSLRTYGIGCACPLHRRKMAEILGNDEIETCSYEKLTEMVFHKGPNEWRNAWIKAQGDSLRDFAAMLRKELDTVAPESRLGICGVWTTWDLDGISAYELAQILAGPNTRPYLRISGAPYWSSRRDPDIPGLFEINSLHTHFCREINKTELFAEGDCYPRPRHNCASAYYQICDAFWRADGTYEGSLNYLVDYIAKPRYEKGYYKAYIKALPLLEKFGDYFKGERSGVRVYEYMNKLAGSDFDYPDFNPTVQLERYPYPFAGQMLADNCVPTVYEGKGICGICFGENAKYIDLSEIKNGMILDAQAAMILAGRGADVGITGGKLTGFMSFETEYFVKYKDKCSNFEATARYLEGKISADAEIQSFGADGKPLSYFYDGKDGKFLVFLFDTAGMMRVNNLLNSYYRTRQLVEGIERISDSKIPVVHYDSPYVYQLNRTEVDIVTVGIFNGFIDKIIDPEFIISDEYDVIDYLGCSGVYENGVLRLESDIESFGYVAFKLRKKK